MEEVHNSRVRHRVLRTFPLIIEATREDWTPPRVAEAPTGKKEPKLIMGQRTKKEQPPSSLKVAVPVSTALILAIGGGFAVGVQAASADRPPCAGGAERGSELPQPQQPLTSAGVSEQSREGRYALR